MAGDQHIFINQAQQLHIAQHNEERWRKDGKEKFISARIPQSLQDAIKTFAKEQDMSDSRAIRTLLIWGFRWKKYRNKTFEEALPP